MRVEVGGGVLRPELVAVAVGVSETPGVVVVSGVEVSIGVAVGGSAVGVSAPPRGVFVGVGVSVGVGVALGPLVGEGPGVGVAIGPLPGAGRLRSALSRTNNQSSLVGGVKFSVPVVGSVPPVSEEPSRGLNHQILAEVPLIWLISIVTVLAFGK